jgi:hypothetical protein
VGEAMIASDRADITSHEPNWKATPNLISQRHKVAGMTLDAAGEFQLEQQRSDGGD